MKSGVGRRSVPRIRMTGPSTGGALGAGGVPAAEEEEKKKGGSLAKTATAAHAMRRAATRAENASALAPCSSRAAATHSSARAARTIMAPAKENKISCCFPPRMRASLCAAKTSFRRLLPGKNVRIFEWFLQLTDGKGEPLWARPPAAATACGQDVAEVGRPRLRCGADRAEGHLLRPRGDVPVGVVEGRPRDVLPAAEEALQALDDLLLRHYKRAAAVRNLRETFFSVLYLLVK